MSSESSFADPEKTDSPSGPETLPAHGQKVTLSDVDVAAQLTAGKDLDAVDEVEVKRVL